MIGYSSRYYERTGHELASTISGHSIGRESQVDPILDPATGSDVGEGNKAVDRAETERAFSRDLFCIARNRKFCTTKKRYIDCCPFNAKNRDRVCILFRGQIPYVARKERKGYRLLGEAYIHGVMYGEVLKMPGIKIEAIELV